MKPTVPIKCNITHWDLAKECKVNLNLKYLLRKFNLLTKVKKKSHIIISREERNNLVKLHLLMIKRKSKMKILSLR